MANDLVMRIIMQASDKASAAFGRIKNASNSLSGALHQQQNELKALEKAQKNFEKYKDAVKQLRQAGVELRQTQARILELNSAQQQNGNLTKQQQRELQQLRQRAKQLAASQTQLRQTTSALGSELQQAGVNVRNMSQAQAQLNTRHDAAVRAIERHRAALARLNRAQRGVERARELSGNLQNISAKSAIGAGAVAAGMSVPVKAYAEAESAAMELRVAMMDKTGKVAPEFAKIDALATSLGDRLPGTTADFKNMMTALIRQGMSAKTILGGTGEAAALLAVQLKKPPAEAAEMAAKLQDATRASEKEMMGLMDKVQKLYYMGTDDQNILGAFAKLSPALDITKLKGEAAIKLFSPLIGMLDQAGLSGESAGNALRKVFSLAMDTDKIKKTLKDEKLSHLNIDFTNGKGEFGGLEKMYTQLAKLQKLNTEQRLKVLKGIFGDDAETLQALNTMIEKGQAGYNEFAAKMEAQASLQQRVNATLGTVTNLWDSATGSFTNFMVAIGESMQDEIRTAIGWIDNISTKLGAWAKANPETANTLLKIAGAIGIFLAVLAVLSAVLATVVVPMAMLKFSWVYLLTSFSSGIGLIGKVAAVLKILGTALLAFGRIAFTFLLTNPFGWVVLAVGALYMLWRNWDKVKNALIAGWNGIDQLFRDNPILNFLVLPIGLMRIFINNWDYVKVGLALGWQFISNLFGGNSNPIIRWVNIAIAHFQKFGFSWESVKSLTLTAWESIKNYVSQGIGWIVNKLMSFAPVNYFISGFSAVLSYLGSLANTMYNSAANLVQSLISGIAAKLQPLRNMWNSVTSIFNGISSTRAAAAAKINNISSKVAGFSRGGYTGAGGINEAAGIVHRGEVVFSQADVKRFGGWQVVETLRRKGLAAWNGLREKAASLTGSLPDTLRTATPMLRTLHIGGISGSTLANMAGIAARIGGSEQGGLLTRAADKLGEWFGSKQQHGTQPAALPAYSQPAPVHIGGDTVTIHVHAAPNMDVRAIADMVMQRLQQHEAAKKRRANSRFSDKD